MTAASRFGVMGMAVMGQNLARNLAHHGIPVAVYNRTEARTREFVAAHGDEGPITATSSPRELVAAIARPRPILLMVKAGAAVDAAIGELAPLLDPGDILIDGGNSLFTDTRRRAADLEGRGLRFLGTGVSGGETGALEGPSIMPGGTPEAYREVEPVLTRIAAQVDGTPCCTYIGTDGAGHFVKMVHNGIEYSDMQLIAEAYDLLRHALGMTPAALAEIFATWDQGELESYLIHITARVLAKTDSTGGPLVDSILDEAEQKGTGRWTSQNALDLGVPLTSITEAVFARMLSARRDERVEAAGILAGPGGVATAEPAAARADGEGDLVDDVRDALYASKIVSYAQGFEQMIAAAETYGWNLDLGAIATIWRGGCIIRARFLDRIREAYADHPGLRNLMLATFFRDALASHQRAWRRVVREAVDRGIPAPAFSSALAYYDGLRRERGPGNLIQGLRDLFGAHTYRRLDAEGVFHTRWDQDGAEVSVEG
jgi:6-phosphogluconate dehydrogenase